MIATRFQKNGNIPQPDRIHFQPSAFKLFRGPLWIDFELWKPRMSIQFCTEFLTFVLALQRASLERIDRPACKRRREWLFPADSLHRWSGLTRQYEGSRCCSLLFFMVPRISSAAGMELEWSRANSNICPTHPFFSPLPCSNQLRQAIRGCGRFSHHHWPSHTGHGSRP